MNFTAQKLSADKTPHDHICQSFKMVGTKCHNLDVRLNMPDILKHW